MPPNADFPPIRRDLTLQLDDFDRHILDLLQQNAARTADSLANEIALSASAIQRRIKKLREEGVIRREIAVVDAEKVGAGVTFIVGLQVEKERQDLLHSLRRWCKREIWIQQAYYVTGDVDFVLVVSTPDMAKFEALMQRLLRENPNVRRFDTNVAMSVLKQGLFVPVRHTAT